MTRPHLVAPRRMSSVLLAALLLLAACRSTPVVPVPPPLPEFLAEETADTGGGAFLGVRGSENDSGSLDDWFADPGVRVDAVVENSPAARADLRAGDLLLALGDHELEDPRTLDALLARFAPGDVVLRFRRGDAVLEATATLTPVDGARPPPDPLWLIEPLRTRAGYRTVPDGVRLVTAADDSPLLRAGVPVGARLLALDGEPLVSDRQLVRRLRDLPPGGRVTLRVDDGSGARDVRLRLFAVPRRVTHAGVPILFDYESTPDGERQRLSLLDLWFLQLFRYERTGAERTWVFLELFGFELFGFATGQGELE